MGQDQKKQDISRLLDKIDEETRLIQKVRKAQMEKEYQKFKSLDRQKKKVKEELAEEKKVADKHHRNTKFYIITTLLTIVLLYMASISRELRTAIIENYIFMVGYFLLLLLKKKDKF